jgi:hypothetical protein
VIVTSSYTSASMSEAMPTSMSTSTSAVMSVTFVMFIFVMYSKLFYDGVEMSWIVIIYDVFVKLSSKLICDAQYMMLSKIITDVFL